MQWLNNGNIFGLGHDKDFLLGDRTGTGKMTIQGDPPFFLSPMEAFVKRAAASTCSSRASPHWPRSPTAPRASGMGQGLVEPR